jgi:hypothetical protein
MSLAHLLATSVVRRTMAGMTAAIPLSSFVRDYRTVLDDLADGEVVLSQRGGEPLLLSSVR